MKKKKVVAGFPLFLHPSGQWAKMVRNPSTGKRTCFYFGKDAAEAAKRWADEKDDLFAGKPRRKGVAGASPSVSELANVYHDAITKKVAQGEFSQRHVDGCRVTMQRFIDIVGKDCRLETIDPLEWDRIKEELYKPKANRKPANGGTIPRNVARRSPATVDGDIRRINAFVAWCKKKKLIGPVDSEDFKPSSLEDQRKRRTKAGLRHLERETILAILEKAKANYRPFILLGINSGIGGLDIAEMKLSDIAAIHQDDPWVDLPRGKTGGMRRFALWPETKQAILDYLEIRPTPAKGIDPNILFLNRDGRPWVHSLPGSHTDGIGTRFTELRKKAKQAKGTFYDLRRTFAKIGSQVADIQAVRFLMGHCHARNDMLAVYDPIIEDARLKRVTDHVRGWLLGKTSQKTSRKRARQPSQTTANSRGKTEIAVKPRK